MGAGPQVRVDGYSRCIRLAPATVETFEKISKLNPPGHSEAQPRVLERDSPGRWRNSNGGGEICGGVIGGGRLSVAEPGRGKHPALVRVETTTPTARSKTHLTHPLHPP